jgi:transcriptional regulator with XRE-family HTH domain
MDQSVNTLKGQLNRWKAGGKPEPSLVNLWAVALGMDPDALTGTGQPVSHAELEKDTWGKRIQKLRVALKKSIETLAKESGFSKAQLRLMERTDVKVENLRKLEAIPSLARALGLDDPMLLVTGITEKEARERVKAGTWSFGKWVRFMRLARGKSREQFIKDLDLPPGHRFDPEKWERDELIPDERVQSQLEELWNVPLPSHSKRVAQVLESLNPNLSPSLRGVLQRLLENPSSFLPHPWKVLRTLRSSFPNNETFKAAQEIMKERLGARWTQSPMEISREPYSLDPEIQTIKDDDRGDDLEERPELIDNALGEDVRHWGEGYPFSLFLFSLVPFLMGMGPVSGGINPAWLGLFWAGIIIMGTVFGKPRSTLLQNAMPKMLSGNLENIQIGFRGVMASHQGRSLAKEPEGSPKIIVVPRGEWSRSDKTVVRGLLLGFFKALDGRSAKSREQLLSRLFLISRDAATNEDVLAQVYQALPGLQRFQTDLQKTNPLAVTQNIYLAEEEGRVHISGLLNHLDWKGRTSFVHAPSREDVYVAEQDQKYVRVWEFKSLIRNLLQDLKAMLTADLMA